MKYDPQDTRDMIENEIYPRLSIFDVFAHLGNVKEVNGALKADCPECSGKTKDTATFTAYPNKRFGWCWRGKCEYTLSWWKAVQEGYGLSDNRATLFKLAELANFTIPQSDSNYRPVKRIEGIYRIFYEMGRRTLVEAEETLNQNGLDADLYLAAQRKWTEAQVKKASGVIAYPMEPFKFLEHLKSEGYSEELIVSSGLFEIKYEKIRPKYGFGKDYAVLFTYRDIAGRPSGFVSRITTLDKLEFDDGSTRPKYCGISRADGVEYKGVPYGLSGAVSEASREHELLIVEGLVDVELYHASRSCIKRIVAAGGAQLTVSQVDSIAKKLPSLSRFILGLDEDEAGRKGTLRSVVNIYGNHVFKSVDVFVQRWELDGKFYKDLDDWTAANGSMLEDVSPIPLSKWIIDTAPEITGDAYKDSKRMDYFAKIIAEPSLPQKLRDELFVAVDSQSPPDSTPVQGGSEQACLEEKSVEVSSGLEDRISKLIAIAEEKKEPVEPVVDDIGTGELAGFIAEVAALTKKGNVSAVGDRCSMFAFQKKVEGKVRRARQAIAKAILKKKNEWNIKGIQNELRSAVDRLDRLRKQESSAGTTKGGNCGKD